MNGTPRAQQVALMAFAVLIVACTPSQQSSATTTTSGTDSLAGTYKL